MAADLPKDILEQIQKHLSVVDYIRFSAVCTSWRSAAKQNPNPSSPDDIPWIFIIRRKEAFAIRFSPGNDAPCKVYQIPLEAFGYHRIISSVGHYLITAGCSSREINIINPFSSWPQIVHQLPPPSTIFLSLPAEFWQGRKCKLRKNLFFPIEKVAIDGSIAVAFILNNYYDFGHLAYTRMACDHDRSRWIHIPFCGRAQGFELLDIVHCRRRQGLFYILWMGGNYDGFHLYENIVALDFSSSSSTGGVNQINMTLNLVDDYLFRPDPPNYSCWTLFQQCRLVSTSSNLFLVRWRLIGGTDDVKLHAYPRKLHVYKLLNDDDNDDDVNPERRRKWVEVKDLGGYSFFLNRNEAVALSVAEFPKLKSNTIYLPYYPFEGRLYVNESYNSDYIYNLGDESWERFYGWDKKSFDDLIGSYIYDHHLVWFTPRLDNFGRLDVQRASS